MTECNVVHRKLTKAEEEAKLERKQQREALVACNIEADN